MTRGRRVEVDATQQPGEKSLKEKKRKLLETLERILSYYKKEDPEKCAEVKKLIAESELRRRETLELCQTYQAARSQYSVSDIPLPDNNDIPMPELENPTPQEVISQVPPPPPPGPPPDNLLASLAGVQPAKQKLAKPSKSVRFAAEEQPPTETSEVLRPPPPPPGLPPPLFPGNTAPPPLPFLATMTNRPQPHIQSHPVLNMSAAEEPVTITAQPQIRNIQAEVTKFMPTSLKVRRDQPKSSRNRFTKVHGNPANTTSSGLSGSGSKSLPTGFSGDAYETFMKEMDGLL